MIKNILPIICIVILNLTATAQSETKFSAPVKWEKYKSDEISLSFLLPKMPVVVKSESPCNQNESRQFVAYAGEVVYSVKTIFKKDKDFPANCYRKEVFEPNAYSLRINELTKETSNGQQSEAMINGLKAQRFETADKIYWIVDDLKNNRWFELWIACEDKTRAKIEEFSQSLKNGKTLTGIEIGSGSDRMLGDENVVDANSSLNSKNSNPAEIKKPIKVIFKPRPGYTDLARQNQIQGTATFKITFLANGGIGEVIVSGEALKDGLIDEAIGAAKKIAFIPQKVDGKAVTITKTVVYSFTLY